MATFQSVSTTPPANMSSIVITKPTGLAAGDLMVAHIAYANTGGTDTLETLSGWTLTDELSFGQGRSNVQWKIASAGDAAASDFTWTGTGQDWMGGAIFRISGTSTTPITRSTDTNVVGGGFAFDTSTAPPVEQCLILFLTAGEGNVAAADGSAYSWTSSPSITERYDMFAENTVTSVDDIFMAGATGTQAGTGNIGNASCTVTNGSSLAAALHLIAVTPEVGVTVTPDVLSAASSIQDPVISGGATIEPAVLSAASAVQEPTVTTPVSTWSNMSKSSAPTWTNTSKS